MGTQQEKSLRILNKHHSSNGLSGTRALSARDTPRKGGEHCGEGQPEKQQPCEGRTKESLCPRSLPCPCTHRTRGMHDAGVWPHRSSRSAKPKVAQGRHGNAADRDALWNVYVWDLALKIPLFSLQLEIEQTGRSRGTGSSLLDMVLVGTVAQESCLLERLIPRDWILILEYYSVSLEIGRLHSA